MTKRRSLLLISDNEEQRKRLANHLEALEYQVAFADSGPEGLQMLQDDLFDMVFLGDEIPNINGQHVVEYLKNDDKLKNLPVIILSSTGNPENIATGLRLGAEDYVREPLNRVLLAARMDALLWRKQLREHEEADSRQIEKLAKDLQNVILPLGTALAQESDYGRLLERILIEAKTVCNADGGSLYLRTVDDCLRFVIMRTDSLNIAMGGTTGVEIPFAPLHLYDPDTKEPNHHNVVTCAVHREAAVHVPDIYFEKELDFTAAKEFDKRNGYRSVSVLAFPLKNSTNEVVGALQLINAKDPETGKIVPFNPQQRLIAEVVASQAAVALNNQMLMQRQLELQKFERDLQIGSQIQANFLPDKLPELPGWEIAACFHPAREVAGDFYDAFKLSHDMVGLIVADVCDKGVGAALFMSLTRSLFRAFAQQHYSMAWDVTVGAATPVAAGASPSDQSVNMWGVAPLKNAVTFTNDYIARTHPELNMFATTFFGVLDPVTGSLIYINGGHNPPIIVDPAGKIKERLPSTGPAVGMFSDAEFEIKHTRLDPGDLLTIFTDGIIDARNPEGKRFSDKRLMALLEEPASSAEELLSRIEDAVHVHIDTASQFDDVTLMVVRRSPDA